MGSIVPKWCISRPAVDRHIGLASAGVLVLLWARESGAKQASRGLLGGLAAGLLFGLSWLSKESIAYLVPLCGLLLIVDFPADFRKAWPLWMGVAAASGGILLAEMIAYGILSGDFLLRMHENERSFVRGPTCSTKAADLVGLSAAAMPRRS